MRKTFKTTIFYWWRVISRFSQTLKRIIDIGGHIVDKSLGTLLFWLLII